MKLLDFFRSLLPSFERTRISEDVAALRTEIVDNILPAAKAGSALVGTKPLQAAFAKNWTELFAHLLKQRSRANYIDQLATLFASLPEKLDVLDKLVQNYFAKDVTRESVTYRKASLLRYIEIVRFATEFAGRSLLRVIAAETAIASGHPEQVDSQLSPGELKWFNDNQEAFFDSLRVLGISAQDLEKAIESIPDILVVADKAQVARETVGGDALDPLKLGLIGARNNPIYHIRLMTAERQVREFKAKQEEKRQLELRLLAWKEAQHGKNDPKLQQLIEYSEGRLQKLKYELEQEAAELA